MDRFRQQNHILERLSVGNETVEMSGVSAWFTNVLTQLMTNCATDNTLIIQCINSFITNNYHNYNYLDTEGMAVV